MMLLPFAEILFHFLFFFFFVIVVGGVWLDTSYPPLRPKADTQNPTLRSGTLNLEHPSYVL